VLRDLLLLLLLRVWLHVDLLRFGRTAQHDSQNKSTCPTDER
jgi:hypothetical protein